MEGGEEDGVAEAVDGEEVLVEEEDGDVREVPGRDGEGGGEGGGGR